MRRRNASGSVLALGLAAVAVVVWLARTGHREGVPAPAPARRSPTSSEASELAADTIDEIAASYVQLVLAAGRYDPDYVDAYFGPPALREASRSIPRECIVPEGRRLRRALDALPAQVDDRLVRLRRTSLGAHLESLIAVMERLAGRSLPFDDEVRVVYDVELPPFDEEANAAARAELDRLLPGRGPLASRYASWQLTYQLPADTWDAVLRASLAECRRRTLAFLELPPTEKVEIEYVMGKPWSAFNEYHGNYHSVVQVNRSAQMSLGSALLYACHEAYPGHHVLNVLQEKHLVDERGWVELSVHPLFAPWSVIAEGTASHALAVVLPGAERDAFLAETLFPLAGLDPDDAATYGRIGALVEQFDRARSEAARRMSAAGESRSDAAHWLTEHTHLTLTRAHGGLAFAQHYGSYVVTYSVGADLVRTWLAANAQAGGPTEQALFAELLRNPYLPRDLRVPTPR